jgi:uncharacterized glyoxalase superfamily protein PhnB
MPEPFAQRVIPMLSYEDVARASEWIAEAFGFRETGRWTDPDGRVTHASMELGDGVVMLGYPSPDYQSPRRHAEVCEHARKWSETPYVVDGVLVYVDDIDAHYERARAAGATILGLTNPAILALITDDDLFATADLTSLLDPPGANATQHYGPYFVIPVPFTQTSTDPHCNAVAMTDSGCTTTTFVNTHFAACAYPAPPCSVTTFFFHYSAGDQSLIEHQWKNASDDRGGNSGDIRSASI